ncbi:MAG: zf-HC2 domain-containing protein [Eubacteriales bacterium]|nr:zf-HC2 domain-containing protein [Eubacteriales bacterium]
MSNKECNIVQDLLPLYYDNACSEESRRFVEKHLAGCSDCQKIYDELKENNVDEVLAKESKGVLERHAKKERNAAYKAGVVIAAILLLPIVITFIVQLATGMGLGVFSVVTASMMLVAALTVVPLMSTNNRLLKCILAGVVSLMLILFFVDQMNGGGNFLLWAIPTVFGISIVLFPIVICLVSLPPVLSDKKALITMTWDTLWLFLTMFIVYYHSGFVGMKDGYTVAAVLLLGVWLVFLVIRYLPVHGLIRAGISTIISVLWFVFANDFLEFIIYKNNVLTLSHMNLSDWRTNICINGNIFFITLVSGCAIGLVLIGIGVLLMRKKNVQKMR